MNVSDTPVAIRLVNPSHPGAMLHRANQLRQAGTLCDVVIQVDGQQFPAHRAVLAAASKMFELLFGQRGDTTRYTLDFLSPRTFAQVLEYMYTSTLEVRPEDLDDLLYAAEILEIEYLEEQCLKLLEGLQGSEGNESEVTEDEGHQSGANIREHGDTARMPHGVYLQHTVAGVSVAEHSHRDLYPRTSQAALQIATEARLPGVGSRKKLYSRTSRSATHRLSEGSLSTDNADAAVPSHSLEGIQSEESMAPEQVENSAFESAYSVGEDGPQRSIDRTNSDPSLYLRPSNADEEAVTVREQGRSSSFSRYREDPHEDRHKNGIFLRLQEKAAKAVVTEVLADEGSMPQDLACSSQKLSRGELEAGRGREDPSGLYLRAPSHHALEMMAAMLGEQHRLTEAQAAGLQAGCFSLSPRRVAVDSLMSLRHSLVAGQHLGGSSQMETSGADGNQASVATRQESMEERQERSGSEVEEAPGTPTRGSVITSARDLHRHSSQDDPEDVVMRQPLDSDEEAMVSPPEVASNVEIEGHTPYHRVSREATRLELMDPALIYNMHMLGALGSGLYPLALHQQHQHQQQQQQQQRAFQAQELASRLGEMSSALRADQSAMQLYLPPGSSSAPGEEKCDICNVSFSSRESLWEHRKLHMEKGYACDLCGKRFLDSLRLRMHLLSHSANGQSYSCEQCGAAFTKESSLEHHREAHRAESGMAYFCLLCGKRLQTQSSLLQHMEVHAGAHEYVCGECNRTFPSHSTLKRHLRSHTSGEHPYECEFCGSCFRDEAILKNHKRLHTGEKPYECNGCGKKFSLKHQLETHYRVHTGEKPFECKLCHQRSRDYSAMIKHLRTHNGAAPYQCTLCLQFCSSLAGMQKHMKAHRPEDIPPDWRIEKTYLYLCYV
ncbi:zinc finger and BTB domain-containing protein 16-A-like isoform X1 [Petromyzon marinus]|uniref:zinc finger and BTB domain-containing protein 16-A-like isoform X1 n=1 Tax=Petromyzon marinus TaxID=7757 RepID=UPI003F6E45C2